jgi:precorrin-2 dehydrogenase / sirohydrochlorin ferrochelatase
MFLFPMFLKLEGRRCLVVGAGKIAEPKIESLLRVGADVFVVAPRASRCVAAWSRAGAIEWRRRRFVPRDLAGALLVIAATGSASANDTVFREARWRQVLCNTVDDPARCDFYCPAVVRRGPFQIAISTGGASPALAQRVRRELEHQFTPDFGEWVSHLGTIRKEVFAQQLSPARRARLLHRLASPAQFENFLKHRNTSTLGGKR